SILASGGPFQINSGAELNSVVTSPVDGNGSLQDLGAHMVYVRTINPAQSVEVHGVLAFGETNTTAIDHFVIAASTTGPGVSSSAASSVSTTGATLNGSINPYGLSTTGRFIWGTDPFLLTGTTTTADVSIGSGTTAVSYSTSLASLTPDTVYYYRASGTNSNGTNIGTILSFKTGPEIGVDQPSGTGLVSGSSTVNFGSQAVGSAATSRTFVVRNTGSLPLTFTASSTGTNSSDFTVSPTSSVEVAAGATANVVVSFQPGSPGSRIATLSLSNNDSDENPFNVALTGSGLNTAPTNLALSSSTVAENVAADTVVGTFTTTDSNVGDTFTYTLVGGTGSTDN
ncbi:MAG: choice-of-anchor D domain-containing protein, partial [Verrucomicrobiaceae bacterium]